MFGGGNIGPLGFRGTGGTCFIAHVDDKEINNLGNLRGSYWPLGYRNRARGDVEITVVNMHSPDGSVVNLLDIYQRPLRAGLRLCWEWGNYLRHLFHKESKLRVLWVVLLCMMLFLVLHSGSLVPNLGNSGSKSYCVVMYFYVSFPCGISKRCVSQLYS